ncbi:hypothetical protein TNCV_1683971 [Trichonephila clavipes]|nr:hypothetical protein TNCV_1683971 [Trichonephila clavipes]
MVIDLRPVVAPYRPGLPNAIFRQDNAILHVRHVLTFYDRQHIRLLPGLQFSHPLKTSCHRLLTDWPTTPLHLIRGMKCGIDLKLPACMELPVSFVQTQFDSMPN